MAGIQVGGIVSGMDTNAIVDQLIEQAQIPVDRLYGDFSYKNLEDKAYTKVNDYLGNLSSDLLTLRLESTFKSKTTSSTNESVVTATATTAAAAGSHTIKVEQQASNAQASSSYTRYALSQSGSTVTAVTGMSYDFLEGAHEVTVSANGTLDIATTVMTVSNVGLMSKSSGAELSDAVVSATGTLAVDFSGDFSLTYTDANGNDQTATLNGVFANAGDDITELASNLEYYMNQMLNDGMGTSAVQYVAFRADYDKNDGTWNMAMYETTADDYNIAIGGTDSGLRDELGFAESYTPTTTSTTKITKYHVANDTDTLQEKMFDDIGGIVSGAEFTLSGDITEGSFTIAQDATLKVSSNTKAYYTGTTVTAGSGLDITAEGLDYAGFSKVVTDDANGYFTINDVKITIEDQSDLTVNDLMGIINASGAGVTATYDSVNDRFKIQSNTPGSTSISLGAYGDTSNLLSIMGLGSGATYTSGSTSGSISTSSELINAGFTAYPYSGTFTINGVSIYVDTSEESLEDLMAKVNSSGAGVTMTYDSTSDKVTLKSDSIDPIEVGSPNDTSTILQSLNLTNDTTETKTIGQAGTRAVVVVDGTTYIRESNTVDDIIAGVTLTLNGESDTSATINIAVDTEKAVEAFASLVSHYNELMSFLNVPEEDDEEDDYTAYLTDTKKETMSDDAISDYMEKYELYNTYDIIRKSSELRNMDTIMRKMFFAERPGITGSVNDMSDLGIEIAGGDLDEQAYGYLVELSTDYDTIYESLKDNSDFINMLTNSSEDVYSFFANTTDDDDDSDEGWARYYKDMLVDRYTGDDGMIGSKLGSSGTIYSELSEIEDRITRQEERVENQLERYWAQFTAMEQAIAEAQAAASEFSNASSG